MANNQSTHAYQIVARFQAMLAEDDNSSPLSNQHSEELALLIEAALDAVLVEQLEKMAVKLEQLAHDLRHDEVF